MQDNLEQKQDINRTPQVPCEENDSLKTDQKLISNEMYMQKLIENFGYSTSDLEYIDLPPPPYSELSIPISIWKQEHTKIQLVSLSNSKPSKFFLFLCIIYVIRNLFETMLGYVLASLTDHFLLFSVWPGCLLFSGIIILYIAYQRSSEIIDRSRHIYILLLFSHIMYLVTILFAYNIPDMSITICPSLPNYLCFDIVSSLLQRILIGTIMVAIIHDLYNIQMAYLMHYKTKVALSTTVF